jgi:hypothetical protein
MAGHVANEDSTCPTSRATNVNAAARGTPRLLVDDGVGGEHGHALSDFFTGLTWT